MIKKKEEKKRNQILVEKFVLDKFEIYMKYIFLLLEMIIELYEFHFQFQLFTFLSNLESSKVNRDLL